MSTWFAWASDRTVKQNWVCQILWYTWYIEQIVPRVAKALPDQNQFCCCFCCKLLFKEVHFSKRQKSSNLNFLSLSPTAITMTKWKQKKLDLYWIQKKIIWENIFAQKRLDMKQTGQSLTHNSSFLKRSSSSSSQWESISKSTDKVVCNGSGIGKLNSFLIMTSAVKTDALHWVLNNESRMKQR